MIGGNRPTHFDHTHQFAYALWRVWHEEQDQGHDSRVDTRVRQRQGLGIALHESNRGGCHPLAREAELGWSRVHAHLAPYVRHLCDEAGALGLPAQRPLFLHYPDDPALYAVQDQFLYGADLLVAPVIEEGATMRTVILPGEGEWLDVWSGTTLPAGTHSIAAPLGRPPVFHRAGSVFAALFAGLPKALAE